VKKIGESEGLNFWYVGGFGRSLGRLRWARAIAACTSGATRSTLRSSVNVRLIVLTPALLSAIMACRPLICVNSFSSGRATALAMVAGLAPG